MPIEATQLVGARCPISGPCPACGKRFVPFMRGQVQRSKRFLGILWRQDYCALICRVCKKIVGHESPQLPTVPVD